MDAPHEDGCASVEAESKTLEPVTKAPLGPSRRPLFSPDQAPRLAVQGWLASRLVLLVVVLVAIWLNDWSWSETFTRWDVSHYLAIADHGYTELTQTAFFPGLPLVMAFFSLIGVPPLATGILVSLAGSAMAALALYKLAGGRVPGAVAVIAWSFAPMAVFTFVPYSEAPFCALGFWAFLSAKRDHWGLAAVLTSAACLFRVSGLFLIGALGLLALFGGRATWKRRGTRVAWLGIPIATLAAYVVYLRVRFGSWTVWFDAQAQGWGRRFDWPWNAFIETLHVADIVGSYGYATYMMFRWEVVAFLIGIFVSVWCFVRKRVPEGGWVLSQVLAMSSQVWLISIARSMLLWFPLFTMVGEVGGGDAGRIGNFVRRACLLALLGVEFVSMVWWATRFFAGAWAG